MIICNRGLSKQKRNPRSPVECKMKCTYVSILAERNTKFLQQNTFFEGSLNFLKLVDPLGIPSVQNNGNQIRMQAFTEKDSRFTFSKHQNQTESLFGSKTPEKLNEIIDIMDREYL